MSTAQLLWLQPPPYSENKNTQLFPYLLHDSPLVKLTVAQPDMKIPVFYGTRRFVTVFTTAPPIPVHTLQPSALKFSFIRSSYLQLGLLSCLFSSCFPTKNTNAFLFSPVRTTCPAHSILLDLITLTKLLLLLSPVQYGPSPP